MGYRAKMEYEGRNNLLHPTLNQTDFIEKICEETRDKIVVNVGSGPLRPIPHAINVDFIDSYEVDSVSSAYELAFDDDSVDFVVSIGLLEHVKYPLKVIEEFKRILKPAGEIYCEVPFLQPYHAAPNDYWRTTVDGLCTWLEDFEQIDMGFSSGPSSTVGWILREYMQYVNPIDEKHTAESPFFPFFNGLIKYVDDFMLHEDILDFDKAKGLASSIYFYGKKNSTSTTCTTEKQTITPDRAHFREQKLASYIDIYRLCKEHIASFLNAFSTVENCAIYGSGELAEMLISCLKEHTLTAIIDQDKTKWNTTFLGVPIISIDKVVKEKIKTIFIASIAHKDTIAHRLNEQLADHDINIVPLEI